MHSQQLQHTALQLKSVLAALLQISANALFVTLCYARTADYARNCCNLQGDSTVLGCKLARIMGKASQSASSSSQDAAKHWSLFALSKTPVSAFMKQILVSLEVQQSDGRSVETISCNEPAQYAIDAGGVEKVATYK
jgi:hypothetical protein